MKILLNNIDLNEALYGVSNIGFVPTMGSLHKGHISLVKRSLKECRKTIVSIFVNPSQFNNKNDYKIYPRNNKRDLSILKKLKVNFVFLPSKKDIYKSKIRVKKKLSKKDQILCAKFRKGHFEGVIDVMERLSKLIKPQKIFMGEKDYQQLFLVKKYVEKKFKTKIIPCKTIRDKRKLALSSRNLHLKKSEINNARKIANNLSLFKKKLNKKINLNELLVLKKKELKKLFNIKIEYLEIRNKKNLKISNNIKNSNIFIAYYIKKIRLIDNF
tara:strand:+ start:323 stop:1135 length:813 start_codon:yes stop_codon:yes gene_type:complete